MSRGGRYDLDTYECSSTSSGCHSTECLEQSVSLPSDLGEASRVVRKSPSVCTRGLRSRKSEHRRLFLVFGCWKTFGEGSCTRQRAKRNAQGCAEPQFFDRRRPRHFVPPLWWRVCVTFCSFFLVVCETRAARLKCVAGGRS